MRRSFAIVTLLALAAACSDSSSTTPRITTAAGSATSRATAIDQLIVRLYPRGLETATGARWDRIDVELGTWNATTGQWTGANADQGRKHLLDLAKFIQSKAGDIETSGLEGGESKDHAASRLIAAMAAYATGGPTATIPSPTADLVVAVVPAGAAAVIKTPSEHAGVSLPAGSTSEERVIAITQNSAVPPGPCKGQLAYTGCQFGLFYKFESVPHLRLNVPGRFAVCLDFSSPYAPTAAQHERARLAHDLPADPADYSPDGTQVQGIEILHLIGTSPGDPPQEGFLDCEHPAPPPVIGFKGLGKRLLYELAEIGGKVLSPKKLYAYDQGPESSSRSFSSFNAVDPQLESGCVTDCASPILALRSIEPGASVTYYNLTVTNRAAYSDLLFAASPSLPPCGLNTNSSRTWVDIYNAATNARIYGFCALGAAENLNLIWFGVPTGSTPPSGVYIKMVDRLTNTTYTSNTLSFSDGSVDQVNDPETGTTAGCGGSGGSIYQSFTPAAATLSAVELKFRAGGSFPTSGFSTNVVVHDGAPDGPVVARGTASVPGSFSDGFVRFSFDGAASVNPEKPYVIEWQQTTSGDISADAILSWYAIDSDTYSRGIAYGCAANPAADWDRSFKTYR